MIFKKDIKELRIRLKEKDPNFDVEEEKGKYVITYLRPNIDENMWAAQLRYIHLFKNGEISFKVNPFFSNDKIEEAIRVVSDFVAEKESMNYFFYKRNDFNGIASLLKKKNTIIESEIKKPLRSFQKSKKHNMHKNHLRFLCTFTRG